MKPEIMMKVQTTRSKTFWRFFAVSSSTGGGARAFAATSRTASGTASAALTIGSTAATLRGFDSFGGGGGAGESAAFRGSCSTPLAFSVREEGAAEVFDSLGAMTGSAGLLAAGLTASGTGSGVDWETISGSRTTNEELAGLSEGDTWSSDWVDGRGASPCAAALASARARAFSSFSR